MIFNLIQKRTSIRTFDEKSLQNEDIDWIKEILESVNNETGPGGNSFEFRFFMPGQHNAGSISGSYGVIRNTKAYITGTSPNTESSIEDFGFLLEKIVIRLMEREIGSCWLGGNFNRDDFSSVLNLIDGEIIPAVVPVGYIPKDRRTTERLMRFVIKADKRKPWTDLFYLGDFSKPMASGNLAGEYSVLMSSFESVRLGPSSSNKQPWRVVFDPKEGQIHFYLDEDPKYSIPKLGYSMQLLDAGIAMYHFSTVAAENGFYGNWVHDNPGIGVPSANYKYIRTFSL
jgi:nitroreductase